MILGGVKVLVTFHHSTRSGMAALHCAATWFAMPPVMLDLGTTLAMLAASLMEMTDISGTVRHMYMMTLEWTDVILCLGNLVNFLLAEIFMSLLDNKKEAIPCMFGCTKVQKEINCETDNCLLSVIYTTDSVVIFFTICPHSI